MKLARRHFLRSVIAGLISNLAFTASQAWAADRYIGNLKQEAGRKLALLVGINQYQTLPLSGCVSDVELQRELLIHRFGFRSQDILTLTDKQATRSNIIAAIQSHLIAQTLPDDLAVFHFSGYGCRLQGQNAITPVDAGNDQDLTVDNLLLLLGAIATKRITCILDSGFSNSGNVGNFRIRARPPKRESSEAEGQLKAELMAFGGQRQSPLLLQAAVSDQLCVEGTWQGFSSGIFTYVLTQQLWQLQSTFASIYSNIIETTDLLALSSRESISWEKEEQAKQLQSLGNGNLVESFGIERHQKPADGYIQAVSSDRHSGEVWLGGISLMPLNYYGGGAVLQVSDSDRLLQVRSHNGLTARVEGLNGTLTGGALIREKTRVLPRNLKLNVALDQQLTKIERIDASSAISALGNAIGVNALEQFADCLFGGESASYGLFSVGRTPLLGAFGAIGESVGTAIRRLQPQFESLLATKLLHLTANAAPAVVNSQALKVSLEATSPNGGRMIATHSIGEVSDHSGFFRKCLTVGDRLTCTLENRTDDPLHVIILSLDARGKMMTPNFVTSPYASDSIIPAQQTLTIPQPIAPFEWLVSAPQGLVDVQIIISRLPLNQTMLLLERYSRQSPTGLISVVEPLRVVRALLSDLQGNDNDQDFWTLDVANWVTLGFTYRVA